MSRKLSLAYEFSSKTRNNTLPLKNSFNDIQINMCYIKLTSVETTQKLACAGSSFSGGSEMNAMNSYYSNLHCLNHSGNHSWSECNFSEHSWCENHESCCEHSSSNCKSIFVNGVLA